MIDQERVVKGLEHCQKSYCDGCPYVYDLCDEKDCIANLARDVLALLKERDEPIRPTLNGSHSYVSDAFKCGKCGHIIRFHAKYCENCGQGVEWNA